MRSPPVPTNPEEAERLAQALAEQREALANVTHTRNQEVHLDQHLDHNPHPQASDQ